MKKFLLFAIVLLITATANAQLANTIWKGAIKGDAAQVTIFAFKKDTAIIYSLKNEVIETMRYTFKAGVLTLAKLSGQSDCGTATPGKYKIAFNNSAMSMATQSDDCYDRSSALNATNWERQKKH